jgi:hypothetical protein
METIARHGKLGSKHIGLGTRSHVFNTALSDSEFAEVQKAMRELGAEECTRAQIARHALLKWARLVIQHTEGKSNDLTQAT